MTPQEWIKDTLNRWPTGHHVAEGATHLAAALEEIAELKKRIEAAESFAESMRKNRDEVLRSSQQEANDAARLRLVVHNVYAAIGNEVSR